MGSAANIDLKPELEKWKTRIGKATDKVDIMTSILNELLDQRTFDMKALSKTFFSGLSVIEKLPNEAKSIAKSIEAKKKSYLSKWQKEYKNITDPKLKEKAESLRDGIVSGLSNLEDLANKLPNYYAPFIDGLKDIKKSLAQNLDIQKLFSIATNIIKSKDDALVLKKKIDEFLKQLINMQNTLTTEL
ncbi:MAG: hypothetical protein NC936_04620 [Candidatus Omnitrophica bacterium]|nr:hypothetical protein [Candidatus Omnitrophota bacterium]